MVRSNENRYRLSMFGLIGGKATNHIAGEPVVSFGIKDRNERAQLKQEGTTQPLCSQLRKKSGTQWPDNKQSEAAWGPLIRPKRH